MWAAKSGNFYNFGSHFVQILSDLLAQACGFDADERPCYLFIYFFCGLTKPDAAAPRTDPHALGVARI